MCFKAERVEGKHGLPRALEVLWKCNLYEFELSNEDPRAREVLAKRHALLLAYTNQVGDFGWFDKERDSCVDIFNVGLDGPFGTPATPDSFLNYPHLRAIFVLAEGLIPGISFDASYDKKSLGDDADGSGIVEEDERFFADLFSADGAVVQARFNYQTGPAVISFTYNILFDPDGGEPEITSGLESSIDLF